MLVDTFVFNGYVLLFCLLACAYYFNTSSANMCGEGRLCQEYFHIKGGVFLFNFIKSHIYFFYTVL